jgi:DNA replication licensing factor MCM7
MSGIFMPKPYTGFKAIKAGLLTDTYVLASDIRQVKQKYELLAGENAALTAQVHVLAQDPEAYAKLAASIARPSHPRSTATRTSRRPSCSSWSAA